MTRVTKGSSSSLLSKPLVATVTVLAGFMRTGVTCAVPASPSAAVFIRCCRLFAGLLASGSGDNNKPIWSLPAIQSLQQCVCVTARVRRVSSPMFLEIQRIVMGGERNYKWQSCFFTTCSDPIISSLSFWNHIGDHSKHIFSKRGNILLFL